MNKENGRERLPKNSISCGFSFSLNSTQLNSTKKEIFQTIERIVMGFGTSRLETDLGTEFPANEHYFGLTNYGNTCYVNSVLQALYFCVPFREGLLHYYSEKKRKEQTMTSPTLTRLFQSTTNTSTTTTTNNNNNTVESEESILTVLCEHFKHIASEKRRTGVIAPKRLISQLKKQNSKKTFSFFFFSFPFSTHFISNIFCLFLNLCTISTIQFISSTRRSRVSNLATQCTQ
jgi:uncharacterized UBP type Zn finger protein